MDFLELNGINRRSITKNYKANSLEQLWFLVNGVTTSKSDTYEGRKGGVYIERDSLIQKKFRQGKMSNYNNIRYFLCSQIIIINGM